jgi:hypothetical protein
MSSRHPPVTLPDTEVRLLKSSIVNDTYRLPISLPGTYANSDKTYPVVYLTDGNGLLPLVRGISEALSGGLEIPRLIIVGIGYDTDDARAWGRLRERDFLPTDASATDASRRQAFTKAGVRRGQAGAFLRFIQEELKPFINANYRTNSEDGTYIGNVTNVKTLAKRLQARRYPGLQLTTHVLANETHFSVIPAAVSRGLRAVFPQSVWERDREAIQEGE